MKVQSVKQTNVITLSFYEDELRTQHPDLYRMAMKNGVGGQLLNGTGVTRTKRAKSSPSHAPKRQTRVVAPVAHVKGERHHTMIKCPLDHKPIKLTGARQHIRSHAKELGYGTEDINELLANTFPPKASD